MKKPSKKDNTIADKKQEKLNQYLVDLEDQFLKHVAEDEGGNDAATGNGKVNGTGTGTGAGVAAGQ